MEKKSEHNIQYVSEILSEVAVTLMMNGANTSRVIKNTQRIAGGLGYDADLFLSLSGLVLSVRDDKTDEMHTIVRAIPHVGVNFEIVSEISILSWRTVHENTPPQEVYQRLREIKAIKHYPNLFLLPFVGLAGASLCRMMGGTWFDFAITFLATVFGLVVRQHLTKKKYNVFVAVTAASFSAVSVVNIFRLLTHQEHINAFATCVLFLIPGVPLINSFIDILEGYISQGIFRGVFGSMLVFVIALGLFLSLFIFGYGFH
ncbi:MAG: threonine/serine exporter family protein [Flavobacteriaceae bacterium]|jgi:uncharacterized membrane protein YjjP (DUF1212 family)|nr:threonine/serine exporter family protein [Flavobacteriaceae bacterium]